MNIQYGFCKRLLLVLFAAVIAVCFYTISQVHRVPLMENGGRSFVKAQVVSIVQDHEQAGDIYIGDQTVQLKLLTGEHAGETVQATSSATAWLFLPGVHMMGTPALVQASTCRFAGFARQSPMN